VLEEVDEDVVAEVVGLVKNARPLYLIMRPRSLEVRLRRA